MQSSNLVYSRGCSIVPFPLDARPRQGVGLKRRRANRCTPPWPDMRQAQWRRPGGVDGERPLLCTLASDSGERVHLAVAIEPVIARPALTHLRRPIVARREKRIH